MLNARTPFPTRFRIETERNRFECYSIFRDDNDHDDRSRNRFVYFSFKDTRARAREQRKAIKNKIRIYLNEINDNSNRPTG